MRSFLILAVCLLGANSWAEVTLEGRMPEDLMPQMGEVIAAALSGSQIMEQREFLEREAEGRKVASHAVLKPSLGTSFAFRQEDDQEAIEAAGFESRVIYNVTLTQPVYHWGALQSQRRIGDLQYEMETLSTKSLASSVVARVRREYMALVLMKQQVERSRLDLEQEQLRLDFQIKEIEVGSASDASLLPYRLAVQRSELALLRVTNDWRNALEDFSVFTTLDPRRIEELLVDVIPACEIEEREISTDFEPLFVAGMEANEDLEKLDLDLGMEKEWLRIADTSLRPKINADLGLSSNALDVDGTRREQSYAYFGLSVSWNIFDGFRKKGRVMEVLNRMSRKEKDKALAEEAIARGFKRLAARLEIERQALAIEEKLFEAMVGRFDWIRDSVEAELMPSSELVNVQREYDATLLRTQQSRISYLIALSDLVAELGLDTSSGQ